jgi:VIT1/CCC1 family predicted Fe2+/Mn2+ transporter
MLLIALVIMLLFNYYVAIIEDKSFFKHFIEMATICLVVALLSFGIGLLVKNVLGFDI